MVAEWGCVGRLRLEAGLTQTELAKQAGITQGHVAAIESGRDVRLSTLRKIFNVLDVEVVLRNKRTDAILEMLSALNAKLDLILDKNERILNRMSK